MTKVLITGCAGLFGANYSRHLLKMGHEVVGIDNLSGGFLENIPEGVKFHSFDLLDHIALENLFFWMKPDYVYHFAAYAAVGLSPYIRRFNYQNNMIASANLINECVKSEVKKIVFTSSMDVYGSQQVPFKEELTPLPEDPYGIAKYSVELDLKSASEYFDLKYTIIRPHNVFGVYQNIWDRYRNVIGIWIRQALSGEPITVFGDGSQVRSFSDIQFYMKPLDAIQDDFDGETFNIGADQYITILDLAKLFQDIAEKHVPRPPIKHLEPRKEVHTAYCDHTKAKEKLEFHDGTDIEQLIDKMFVWAKSAPKRKVKNIEYEIEKNMYEFWR
jgi:UDP-glucose 4-epimerase